MTQRKAHRQGKYPAPTPPITFHDDPMGSGGVVMKRGKQVFGHADSTATAEKHLQYRLELALRAEDKAVQALVKAMEDRHTITQALLEVQEVLSS